MPCDAETVPMLCDASPYEGCWGPKAFETPYKGSLCGFLKLILSESPEANSVQLDYHSAFGFGCFSGSVAKWVYHLNRELLTVINPSHEMGSVLSCFVYWETHRHLEYKPLLPSRQGPYSNPLPLTPRKIRLSLLSVLSTNRIMET